MDRDKKKSTYYAPNLLCVGVDRTEGGDYAGRIWHQYDDKPIEYKNLMELLRRMEHLYDAWNFPQASTNSREFRKKLPEENVTEETGRPVPGRIEGKRGERGTFLVRVKFRQNATWQGEVTWLEEDRQQRFLSALELLKLIDTFLSDEEEQPERKIR